jgi:hypothetical protein
MTILKSTDAIRADMLDPLAQKLADAAARLPQLEEGNVDAARIASVLFNIVILASLS